MKIIIIGQGNVACNLYAAYHEKGIDISMVSSREGLDDIPQNADVYFYAVRDEVLGDVINKVHVPARALHLHTSGTMPISLFGSDKPHSGIFYPLQTFSKQNILKDFSTIPVFIEANGIDDISAIYSLALILTSHIYEVKQQDRERLHLAGVWVNNFTNYMYQTGSDILKGTHLPFQVLLPLIDETAQKVHTLSPQDAQTGPARRSDVKVMNHHLSLMTDPEQKHMYELISQQIAKKY